jgi:hypothetical protein
MSQNLGAAVIANPTSLSSQDSLRQGQITVGESPSLIETARKAASSVLNLANQTVEALKNALDSNADFTNRLTTTINSEQSQEIREYQKNIWRNDPNNSEALTMGTEYKELLLRAVVGFETKLKDQKEELYTQELQDQLKDIREKLDKEIKAGDSTYSETASAIEDLMAKYSTIEGDQIVFKEDPNDTSQGFYFSGSIPGGEDVKVTMGPRRLMVAEFYADKLNQPGALEERIEEVSKVTGGKILLEQGSNPFESSDLYLSDYTGGTYNGIEIGSNPQLREKLKQEGELTVEDVLEMGPSPLQIAIAERAKALTGKALNLDTGETTGTKDPYESRAQCLGYVDWAIKFAGLDQHLGADGKDAVQTAVASGRYKEVILSSDPSEREKQLKALGRVPGVLISMFNESSTGGAGHAVVSLGNGKFASDFLQDNPDPYSTPSDGFRAAVPIG